MTAKSMLVKCTCSSIKCSHFAENSQSDIVKLCHGSFCQPYEDVDEVKLTGLWLPALVVDLMTPSQREVCTSGVSGNL